MKPKPLLVIILILWLATGLRFYRLNAQSFWNDEGNSARLSERPVPAIIEGAASDIHPPLYYLILRGWRELVGDSEFGLRAFSAFAGVLTVAASFAICETIRSRIRTPKRNLLLSGYIRVSHVAALLTAVSPPLVYYSQEARMYALLALWAVLSTWLLLRIHHSPFTIRYPLFYLLAVIAGLYTHYFFPAVLLTHNLLILIWLRQKHLPAALLRRWIAIMITAFLAYLPWLPVFINQTGGRVGMRGSFINFLLEICRWLFLGATIEVETAVPPLVAAALLLAVGAWAFWRQSLSAILSLLIPLLFMYAAGTTRPEFFKFMLVAVPFGNILAALGNWKLESSARGRKLNRRQSLLFNLLIIVFLLGNGRSLQNLYFNPAYARADYRGMAGRIEAENHPNAGIILDAPNQWEVFTYYHRDGAPVYPIPTGRPLPDKIDAELTAIAAQHDRLYAIFWGEAQRDPQRLVERWLDERAFKATDEWIGDVRFVTYAVLSEPAAKIETAVNLPFGEAITLKGYTLINDELAPGDIVQLTLFWQTAVPLDTRYKVFLHLIDASGQLVAQRDSEPGGGLNLTSRWPPSEIINDNHGVFIPASTPGGEYQLLLGLYDVSDPHSRLPIQAEMGVVDAFSVATISIK